MAFTTTTRKCKFWSVKSNAMLHRQGPNNYPETAQSLGSAAYLDSFVAFGGYDGGDHTFGMYLWVFHETDICVQSWGLIFQHGCEKFINGPYYLKWCSQNLRWSSVCKTNGSQWQSANWHREPMIVGCQRKKDWRLTEILSIIISGINFSAWPCLGHA